MAWQKVSCCCLRLSFKPADQAHSWFCREWVAAYLWHPFKPADQAHSWQKVSYWHPWHPFKSADQVHPWPHRQCVDAVPGTLSGLLIKFTLGFAGSELLMFLAPLQAHWSSSFLALQKVSCCTSWPTFHPADQPTLGSIDSKHLLSLDFSFASADGVTFDLLECWSFISLFIFTILAYFLILRMWVLHLPLFKAF